MVITKELMKEKFEEIKMGAKIRYDQAVTWCRENKEIVVALAPAVIGGSVELIKAIVRAHDHAEEREMERIRRHSVYDRSSGMYLETTEELDNDDFRELQKRKRRGMTTGEALEDMGLLK